MASSDAVASSDAHFGGDPIAAIGSPPQRYDKRTNMGAPHSVSYRPPPLSLAFSLSRIRGDSASKFACEFTDVVRIRQNITSMDVCLQIERFIRV